MAIIKEAIRRRQPLPDAIRNAPRLRPFMEPFFEAFQELSTCRQMTGMGPPGPIPWTAIEQYAARHGFHDDAYFDLLTIVRAMDDAFVRHLAEKSKDG